ncbi:FkbM family methyltransferase [Halocynthiibacter sp.]|uniref:FkbM family methyltransferase n=1 Tax=Halocynthiibacter sp. TaxID=1979210 RepID=UPI003C35B2ED
MSALTAYLAKQHLQKIQPDYLKSHPQVAHFAFDLIGSHIELYGRFEHSELTFLETHIFPKISSDTTCLDVGANIGNHSLAFSRFFDQVFAFEPNPQTFQLLKYNASLTENIRPVNCGLSDRTATDTATIPLGNNGAGHLGSTPDTPDTKTISFDLRQLDTMADIQAIDRIGFLKIDVEGHEKEALTGAENTIRKHQPVIAIEILGHQIPDGTSDTLQYLETLGYTHFYQLRDNRPLRNAPTPVARLATALKALVTGRPPKKSFSPEPLKMLPGKNYPMIICSSDALWDDL